MDLKLLALGLAVFLVFTVLLAGFVGVATDLAQPITILFEALAFLAVCGIAAIGVVLIYDLNKLNVRSVITNGKPLLLVQFAKDHVVLIDPARISEPALTLSPSENKPPQIIHGIEHALNQFEMPLLTAPLPSLDVLSDSTFRSLFSSEED